MSKIDTENWKKCIFESKVNLCDEPLGEFNYKLLNNILNFFKCKKILCKSCQWENEDIKLFIFFAFLYKDCGKNLIVFWILISAANTLLYASIWTKKNNSIFEYNYIMYRLWFIGIKSHVEWKKKQIQCPYTFSAYSLQRNTL